jgi:type IV pilus assembly protein PilM
MPSVPFAAALEPARNLFRNLATIKPKEARVTVGLDLGSEAVKVVALGSRKGAGPRPVLAQTSVRLEEGHDADPSEPIRKAVAALHLPTKSVNLSVSGQWVIMRIVEMPAMKPAEMKQALPFEAQRYLPFNLQDVIIDGAVLGPAEGSKQWVLIVACKKELIERRLNWVRQAGLEPALIDVDALALANAYLASKNGDAGQNTHALVDVGAHLSNLVIFKGGSPYLVRDIPWGGDKLLRQVAEQAGAAPEAVAAALAKGDVASLGPALKAATEPLVTELQLSFDYFENRFGQSPDGLLITGGMAQLPGLVDAVKSHFAQPVSAWSPMEGLPAQFTVAYGLALRSS